MPLLRELVHQSTRAGTILPPALKSDATEPDAIGAIVRALAAAVPPLDRVR